jgi:hypothetical protein
MRSSLVVALPLLLVALTGCVPSLHPLYTAKDVIFDAALAGTWRSEEGDTWQITGAPNDAYDVLVVANGEPARLEGHLIRVGEERYLDLYPAEPDFRNEFYAGHLLRVHHFVRVRQKEDALEVAVLDENWLEKQLDAKRYSVRHEKIGDDYLLTAPPAALQAFLREVAADAEAFGDSALYRRER